MEPDDKRTNQERINEDFAQDFPVHDDTQLNVDAEQAATVTKEAELAFGVQESEKKSKAQKGKRSPQKDINKGDNHHVS